MAKRKSAKDLELMLDDIPISEDYKGRALSMTQESSIKNFNEKGRILASMRDIYSDAKRNFKQAIDGLKWDIESAKIITSTRLSYKKNSLDAKITQYYGSCIVVPIEENVAVPNYHNEELDSVISTEDGLRYIRALFGTEDEPENIRMALSNLSYTGLIWVTTASRCPPNDREYKAAGLGHMYGRLIVYSSLDIDKDEGRSRGAMIIP